MCIKIYFPVFPTIPIGCCYSTKTLHVMSYLFFIVKAQEDGWLLSNRSAIRFALDELLHYSSFFSPLNGFKHFRDSTIEYVKSIYRTFDIVDLKHTFYSIAIDEFNAAVKQMECNANLHMKNVRRWAWIFFIWLQFRSMFDLCKRKENVQKIQ